jgi:coenzyme F420-reducing hydrogenase gamma subunit
VSPIEVEQHDESTEEIVDWRFEQLLRVGYESRQAQVLSQRVEVDLHQAVDLVLNGCPPDLALKILV